MIGVVFTIMRMAAALIEIRQSIDAAGTVSKLPHDDCQTQMTFHDRKRIRSNKTPSISHLCAVGMMLETACSTQGWHSAWTGATHAH